VDAEDVHSDGTIHNDERGAMELALTGCSAVNPRAPQETQEVAISSKYGERDDDDGTMCRLLDNFFICDKAGCVWVDGERRGRGMKVPLSQNCRLHSLPADFCLFVDCRNPVGLEVFDDKMSTAERPTIMAFGTLVDPPERLFPAVSKRVKAVMDALALACLPQGHCVKGRAAFVGGAGAGAGAGAGFDSLASPFPSASPQPVSAPTPSAPTPSAPTPSAPALEKDITPAESHKVRAPGWVCVGCATSHDLVNLRVVSCVWDVCVFFW
jgi:hypothetical protein